jgi:predicted O-methyltransferase YrrM
MPDPITPDGPLLCWPLDHFYSPVPNNRLLASEPDRSRVWPPTPRSAPGLDWRGEAQVALLAELGRQSELPVADGPTGDRRDYHAANEMYSRLDAWMLQALLRHFRPKRMVEVGSGWSTLLSARVNREHLEGSMELTCIEPYPPEFLDAEVEGVSRIIASQVERLPLDPFFELSDGDVLFIDSSHTVKTGGDVVFLLQEVVPRLASGVVVHFHDIFLPWDYPSEWVFSGRAWNEQYLVRAFLSFNSAFRILLGVGWLSYYRPDALAANLPSYPAAYRDGGGSLWIQRL